MKPTRTDQMRQIQPSHTEVNALVSLYNAGRYAELESRARLLVSQYPGFGFGWKLLGGALQMQARNALPAFQKAAELMPDEADAHYNLGVALKSFGLPDDAAASYRRALKIKPDYAEAHSNLGNVLKDLGQFDEAAASYRRALKIKPDYADAHYNLGNALKYLGQLDDAVASYRQALRIKPDLADAYGNLGSVLKDLGQYEGALENYRRALQLNPGSAEAHNNLGVALKALGQLDTAAVSFRTAVELKPNYAEAHNNLGAILQSLGQPDAALASYRCAVEIAPAFAEAHSNLGSALQDLGQLYDAVDSFRRALQIKPDYVDAHSNLGSVLKDIGQHDDAVASHRRALQIKPDFTEAYSKLLFALNYHPDLSAEEIYQAYQKYNEQRGIPLRSTWRKHGNDRNPDRRLKIGYVSPDFRHHSCRSFLEPLLAHHDKSRVEVHAYAELAAEDYMTARYKSYVDHWIPTKDMSDAALAERIRADGIDILVELAGHTAGNRLLTFARKPAPVSLSWLGYGYTTGLGAIDYYLTDEASAPAGSEGLFAEQPWRIATPAYVYRPNPDMGEVGNLPARQRGYVTFGTLTRAVRINHHTIRVWSEILKRVGGSRLVIDSLNFKDPAMQEKMASRFAEHGISRDRLEIGFHSPPWDVLRDTDIGLDCFPHNSGTTLFETLYMGVPYITLAGRPSVGRLGSSILQGAGHPEWIAESEEEYIDKAVRLASDLEQLAAHRASLRTEMENSPLLDEPAFALKVEDAYRQMWQLWCKNLAQ
jgi:predicted O-linked N-acetylglucosamine transferase (SPINDLY family)